jgi:hypothetical protein
MSIVICKTVPSGSLTGYALSIKIMLNVAIGGMILTGGKTEACRRKIPENPYVT